MESTKKEEANRDIKILEDFDQFLREIWQQGKRDWKVYDTSIHRRFWDRHVAEPRKK